MLPSKFWQSQVESTINKWVDYNRPSFVFYFEIVIVGQMLESLDNIRGLITEEHETSDL